MSNSLILLPSPDIDGQITLETVIARRPSVAPYLEEDPLTLEQTGQLLWAAQTTGGPHKGTATNGCTWLILYICCSNGVWRYHPREHCLTRHLDGDARGPLADAARNRYFVVQAPCVLVISAVPRRGVEERYEGRWRRRYLPIEAGRVVERIRLQAVALGLASVPVSEFDHSKVSHSLILSRQEESLYLLPVGRPAQWKSARSVCAESAGDHTDSLSITVARVVD
jgi:nitroreductase